VIAEGKKGGGRKEDHSLKEKGGRSVPKNTRRKVGVEERIIILQIHEKGSE